MGWLVILHLSIHAIKVLVKLWHEGSILFTERLSERSKQTSQRQPGLILIA